MIPPFRAIRSAVKDVQRLQDALAKIFNALATKQILDGRLVSGIALTAASQTSIDHGLNRPVRGWIVVAKNAQATVWSSVSTFPNQSLILNTSADVAVSLWIF